MLFRHHKCIDCGYLGIVRDEREAVRSLFFNESISSVPANVELRALNAEEIYMARRLEDGASSSSDDSTEELSSQVVSGLKFPVCYKKRRKFYRIESGGEADIALWKAELWEDTNCGEYMERLEGFHPAQHIQMERIKRSKRRNAWIAAIAALIALAALGTATVLFFMNYEIVL